MKRPLPYILTIGAALSLGACSHGDPEAVLRQAEAYVAEGNYDGARDYCKSLTDTTRVTLTPSQLCRTAIVYARISELDDAPREMVNATECLERAMNINADSVTAFTNQAEIDDKAMLYLIRNVNRAITDPNDIVEETGDEYAGQELLDFDNDTASMP
ncbi:MAG: hypothetical protein LIP09_08215 [Bacteroidales bacterium]|nr:hypothetical protein [Bacteroidales bacterium]